MSLIPVNDRDVRLQATSPRYTATTLIKDLTLSADAYLFKDLGGGSSTPGTITLRAKLLGLIGPATFSCTGGTLTGSTPNERTLTFANMGSPIATVTATLTEGGATYTDTKVISKFSDGANALNAIKIYAYQRAASAPSGSPGAVDVDMTTGAITTATLANGWQKTIPTANGNPLYVTVATAVSSGATDNVGSGEWSGGVVMAQDGPGGTGTNGLNVATVFIFQRTKTGVAPALPSVTATYTYGASTPLTGLNNGWSATMPPASEGAFAHMSSATAVSASGTDGIPASEWAAAQIIAQDGVGGASFVRPIEDSNVWSGGSVITVTDGKVGPLVRRSASGSYEIAECSTFTAIDRTRSYRVRFWARAAAGTDGVLYHDLRQYTAANVNTPNTGNGGRSTYMPIAQVAHTDWREYDYIWNNSHWQTGTTHVKPDFLLNYTGTTGYWEVQGYQFFDATDAVRAQAAADAAIAAIDVISRDDLLSRGEKPAIVLEWTRINDEYSTIDTSAANTGITTERTNWQNAYTNLNTYLSTRSPAYNDTTQDTVINAADFKSNFANYYLTKQVLLNAIAAKAAFAPSLQLGGRNLYKKSLTISGGGASVLISRSTTGFIIRGVAANDGQLRLYNILPSNGTFTISFDLVVDVAAGFPLVLDFCDGSQWTINPTLAVQHFSNTFTISNWSASTYHFIDFNQLSGQNYTFTNFKVEAGNKESGWTPAPEDVAADNAAAQAAADAANIALSLIADDNVLSRHEKPAVVKEWTVITQESPVIQQQATALGVSVTAYAAAIVTLSDYLTSIPGGWSTFTSDSTIDGAVFKTKWSEYYVAKQTLQNAISAKAAFAPSLILGGANLMRRSGQFKDGMEAFWPSNGGGVISIDGGTMYGGFKTLRIAGNYGASSSTIMRLKASSTYTLSAMVKANAVISGGSGTTLHVQCWTAEVPEGTNVHQETTVASDTDLPSGVWKRIWYTFTTPASASQVFHRFYFYPVGAGNVLNVGYVKLEEGNKPTDWIPNAEDVAADNAAAQAAADAANTAISAITANGVLDKSEKPDIVQRYNAMYYEQAGLQGQADSLGVSRAALDSAYAAVGTYLTTLGSSSSDWSNTALDTNIDRTVFNTKFTDYYTAKVALQNAIAAKSATQANGDGYITAPGGGIRISTAGVEYGAIKIRLPVSWTDTMMKFTVDIFEYNAGYSCTLEISGYNYSAGSYWANVTARVLGGSNVEYPVRFGHDGTKCCVWIGEPATVGAFTQEAWVYPQVRVRNVFAGFVNTAAALWADGWQISMDSTPHSGHAITGEVLDTLPGADWSKIPNRGGRPADGATVNIVTSSTAAPSSPVNGDIWVDTNTPVTIKTRVAGAWVAGGNVPTALSQVDASASLKLNGVATGATSNIVSTGMLGARPAGTNGDIYYATDVQILYNKVSGAWVAAANNYTNTNQLTDGANLGATAQWSNIVGQTNAPASNATVGAPAGTNVGSTPATTVESNANNALPNSAGAVSTTNIAVGAVVGVDVLGTIAGASSYTSTFSMPVTGSIHVFASIAPDYGSGTQGYYFVYYNGVSWAYQFAGDQGVNDNSVRLYKDLQAGTWAIVGYGSTGYVNNVSITKYKR